MRSSLNTLRMDIFLNSAILNPFVLLFILHDCREEGLLEDLQPPPQRAKMGAVGAVVYKTMPDQKMPPHTFGIEPTTAIRWHFSGHPSS
jgi:hypothetical protein